MGGNALKSLGLNPQRISTEEQTRLLQEFKRKTEGLFEEIHLVKSLKAKLDHGDTDIATIITPSHTNTIIQDLKEKLRPAGLLKNANIISLEFQNTQIDIALHPNKQKLQTYINFCHYSPFGNILGRMLKQTGCKFGLQGLIYTVRENENPESQILSEILITESLEKTLKIAELEIEPWNQGFETEESLYNYLSRSPLCHPNLFDLKTLDHKNRKRAQKRGDFQRWIEYLKNKKWPQIHPKTTQQWRNILETQFPESNLQTQITNIRAKNEERKIRHKKFNGKLFLDLGVNPPTISKIMQLFQKEIEKKKPFNLWVDNSNPQEIIKEIKSFLKRLEKTKPSTTMAQ
jgi:hypothetical protein